LVANKLDLVQEDPNVREVSIAETKQFATDNNLLYVGDSSALSDTNIKECVEALMERIYET
jgi:hypothetical protein